MFWFQDNSSYKSRFEKIVEELEDIVDPFDLNVFSPYISSNLNKHLQRCGVSITYTCYHNSMAIIGTFSLTFT